jgi:hypothetical protein
LFLVAILSPSAAYGSGKNKFIIFDATQYRGKPDLSAYGIKTLPIVYGHFLWKDRKVKASLPNTNFVKQILLQKRYDSYYLCLDVEHWSIDTEETISDSVRKYRSLLRAVRDIRPQAKIGYYGIPPKRDYFAAIDHQTSERYRKWQDINIQLAGLGEEVDLIFPSLYTFYNKPSEWRRYAIGNITAARAYKKPVLPFLWPQYHESNRLRGLNYIAPEYWTLQLETLAQHADGMVIWGGWDFKHNRPADWDEEAPWWKATKRFIFTKLAR